MKPLLLIAAVACLVGGSAAPSPAARMCVPVWRTVARPNVPTVNSVAAISPTDVWLVGSTEKYGTYTTPTLPVLMHWDGRTLRRYPSFTPTDGHGQLTGISGIAANDVWAVGTDDGDHYEHTLVVMHWDGARWRRMPVPRLRGAAFRADVAEITPDDVWVVGANGADGPVNLHWNGHRWKNWYLETVIPHADGAFLSAVAATSRRDVWAIGTEPSSIDFAGDYPVVVHWNGRDWSNLRVPADLGGTDGAAVAGVAAGGAWVAARIMAVVDNHEEGAFLVRYNRRLQPAHTHYVGSSGAGDVLAAQPFGALLVDGFPDTGPEAFHFDGAYAHWMRTPFSGLKADLNSLSELSPTDIWAAGDRLLARYSC